MPRLDLGWPSDKMGVSNKQVHPFRRGSCAASLRTGKRSKSQNPTRWFRARAKEMNHQGGGLKWTTMRSYLEQCAHI